MLRSAQPLSVQPGLPCALRPPPTCSILLFLQRITGIEVCHVHLLCQKKILSWIVSDCVCEFSRSAAQAPDWGLHWQRRIHSTNLIKYINGRVEFRNDAPVGSVASYAITPPVRPIEQDLKRHRVYRNFARGLSITALECLSIADFSCIWNTGDYHFDDLLTSIYLLPATLTQVGKRGKSQVPMALGRF